MIRPTNVSITFFTRPASTIDLVDYDKDTGFQNIEKFAADNEIDSVYVRFANEDEDRMFDCNKPTHMLDLKDIIASNHPLVVGWRLHHHRRNDKNEKVARKLIEEMSVNI